MNCDLPQLLPYDVHLLYLVEYMAGLAQKILNPRTICNIPQTLVRKKVLTSGLVNWTIRILNFSDDSQRRFHDIALHID